MLRELNCFSSKILDMGMCRCRSHQTWIEKEIPSDEAVMLIRDYIVRQEEREEERAREIERVNKVLKMLQQEEQ